jgi:hypothetical protein
MVVKVIYILGNTFVFTHIGVGVFAIVPLKVFWMNFIKFVAHGWLFQEVASPHHLTQLCDV